MKEESVIKKVLFTGKEKKKTRFTRYSF